jgi:hypothetical protein
MADLLTLYNGSTSAGISAAKALGTSDGRQGTNFFDGTGRGPWSPTSTGTPDVWQGEFTENNEGKNVTPASTNDSSYPLSRWKADALKLAFEGVGPAQRPRGYWQDSRFNTFKDSAGRWTDEGSKLHKYAPVVDKTFQDLNSSANDRIRAGATSTAVRGMVG